MQKVSFPFKCREQAGRVNFIMQPNHDKEHAWGLDLIFPHIPKNEYTLHYDGFPVLSGSIEYPIPDNPSAGYGALLGWIQLVKEQKKDASGEWQMDIYPFAKDISNPFAGWGFKPMLFDAPAKLWDEEALQSDGLVWRAQSYLCYLEDAGMSKRVRVIPGAGFGWGYDVAISKAENGKLLDAKRTITIKEVELLDVKSEWTGRLPMFRKLYPEWTFREFGEA